MAKIITIVYVLSHCDSMLLQVGIERRFLVYSKAGLLPAVAEWVNLPCVDWPFCFALSKTVGKRR